MAIAPAEKECPWCTIFLVTAALACHVAVLIGNLDAANGFKLMGVSTTGWSHIGLGMAEALHEELDVAMGNVTEQLTTAISQIMVVQAAIDDAIALVGEQADQSFLEASFLQKSVAGGAAALAAAGDPIPAKVREMVPKVVKKVSEGLDTMLDIIEPALLQIGKWEESFGDKLQAGISMFSTTIDLVQKLFDQIMSNTNGGGGNDPYMELNTFTLFALTEKDKGIMVQDLKDVSKIYSITALQGAKAEDLHGKYDLNKDAFIDSEEYQQLVIDESVPNIMSVVLRQYAKKLSQVSGVVRLARMRDQVANAVVHYLQLVCAKNMTKVGWVSERLTNASLPMAFTADVMRNLALLKDDPEVLTTADVGAVVIGEMARLNPDYTQQCADLMADPEFWESEGFDPADQAICVQRVTEWTSSSMLQVGNATALERMFSMVSGGSNKSLALLDTSAGVKTAEHIGSMGRMLVKQRQARYTRAKHEQQVSRHKKLMRTAGSKSLFDALLGGATAYRDDPRAASAVKSGVPAVPETLEFAQFLSNNATTNAQLFQSGSFNYSSQSSSAMDAFATQVQGMVKKIQSFLTMLDDYAGEDGVAKLRQKVADFSEEGADDLIKALEKYAAQVANSSAEAPNSTGAAATENATASEDAAAASTSAPADAAASTTAPADAAAQSTTASPDTAAAAVTTGVPAASSFALSLLREDEEQDPESDGFLMIVAALEAMQSVLPQCIDNLKVAKKEVGSVSAVLDSIFGVFETKGKEIFDNISALYAELWTAYFVLLTIITLGLLYYGMWASGWFGGPKHTSDDFLPEHKQPETFRERMSCCWSSCTHCLWVCCETEFCFWSMLLLGQLFVLVMFLVSVLLMILAGVNMFITSGCAAVYVLGDPEICTNTLTMLQQFLTTFNKRYDELAIPLDEVCEREQLATCEIMAEKMLMAGILTTAGAVVAAILTFQMLIQSSILHERARYFRLIDKLSKQEPA